MDNFNQILCSSLCSVNTPVFRNSAPVPRELLLDRDEGGVVFGTTDPQFEHPYMRAIHLAYPQRVGLKEMTEGNAILFGEPGSGKSTGVFMPTLQSWGGSFVALDIKGELLAQYLASARTDHRVVVLDPDDPNGWSVDPLEWLDDDPENYLSNVSAMASIFFPDDSRSLDPFWTTSERAFFSASLLFYHKAGFDLPKTITRVLDLPIKDLCEEISKIGDPDIRHLIGGYSNMKGETLASIERGLRNELLKLSDEEALLHFFRGRREGNRVFSWNDLEKTAVFIRVPPEKVDRWGMGINLLFTMLLRHLERRPEKHSVAGAHLEQCLVAIDELPRLGRLPTLTSALATLRSKGVNMLLAVQSLTQLDAIYGAERGTILDCCPYKVILRVSDPENQRTFAEMIGTYQHYWPSVNTSYDDEGQPRGYGFNVGVSRDYIIQPAAFSSLTGVVAATPFGACYLKKIPPVPMGDIVCDLPTGAAEEKPQICDVKQRSADADALVRTFLHGRDGDTGVVQPDCERHFGSLFLQYFPEYREKESDPTIVEKAFRHLAANAELLAEVLSAARQLED